MWRPCAFQTFSDFFCCFWTVHLILFYFFFAHRRGLFTATWLFFALLSECTASSLSPQTPRVSASHSTRDRFSGQKNASVSATNSNTAFGWTTALSEYKYFTAKSKCQWVKTAETRSIFQLYFYTICSCTAKNHSKSRLAGLHEELVDSQYLKIKVRVLNFGHTASFPCHPECFRHLETLFNEDLSVLVFAHVAGARSSSVSSH